jgi:hypothetical protein
VDAKSVPRLSGRADQPWKYSRLETAHSSDRVPFRKVFPGQHRLVTHLQASAETATDIPIVGNSEWRGLRLSRDRPRSWGVETWRAHLKKRLALGDAPVLPLSRLRTSPGCKPRVRTDRDASGSSAVIVSRSWPPQIPATAASASRKLLIAQSYNSRMKAPLGVLKTATVHPVPQKGLTLLIHVVVFDSANHDLM